MLRIDSRHYMDNSSQIVNAGERTEVWLSEVPCAPRFSPGVSYEASCCTVSPYHVHGGHLPIFVKRTNSLTGGQGADQGDSFAI